MANVSNPEYFVMAAGGIALAAGYAETKRFPDNGYRIVASTGVLVLLASATKGSAVEPVVRGLAILMLISAVYAYIPAFTKDRKRPRKDKANG